MATNSNVFNLLVISLWSNKSHTGKGLMVFSQLELASSFREAGKCVQFSDYGCVWDSHKRESLHEDDCQRRSWQIWQAVLLSFLLLDFILGLKPCMYRFCFWFSVDMLLQFVFGKKLLNFNNNYYYHTFLYGNKLNITLWDRSWICSEFGSLWWWNTDSVSFVMLTSLYC